MTALVDVLRLEVDAATPLNPLRNPSGQMGMYGWNKLVLAGNVQAMTGSASAVAEDGCVFRFTGRTVDLRSAPFPVQSGTYVHVWASTLRISGAVALSFTFSFLDAQGVVINPGGTGGTETMTAGVAVRGQKVLAPAGAVTAFVSISTYDPAGNAVVEVGRIAVRSGLPVGAPFAAYVPANWVNIIGKTGSITTEQGNTLNGVEDEITTGTLFANMQDAAIDPSTSSLLRKGRPVRVAALEGGVRKPVWTGEVETVEVDYNDEAKAGQSLATISLTATDAGAPAGDASLAFLRSGNLEEQIGGVAAAANLSTWDGDKSAWPITAGTPVARDENAKVKDWLRRLSNTYGMYSWIDTENRLRYQLVSYLSSAPVATFSDRYTDAGALYYTSIGLKYGSQSLTNALTVTRINVDEVEDDGAKEYGPYVSSASDIAYGRVSGQIEILAGSPAAVADAVLPIFATPKMFPSNLRVNALKDLAKTLALTPYAAVRVRRTSPAYNEVVRVLRIKHEINARVGGDTWTTTFAVRPLETGTPGTVTPPSAGPDTGPGDVIEVERGTLGSRVRTGTFSIANATYTAIPLNTAVHLDGDVTWDAANNRYVVPKDGRYIVTAGLRFVANATGSRYVGIYINGAQYSTTGTTAGTTDANASLTRAPRLAAGDTVQMRAYQSSGAALNVQGLEGSTFLDVTYLGA